jgi:putative DNA primase/helicase
MTLQEAIRAAGMSPPNHMPIGRFVRFPGCGKSRGNTAGWCRVITPTLAVFGDWSSGLSQTWMDNEYRETEESRKAIARAREWDVRMRARDRQRNREAADRGWQLAMREAKDGPHPYLERKGIRRFGLVHEHNLVVPMWSIQTGEIVGAQIISAEGEKKFLPGTRAKGAIYRFGMSTAKHVVLCEGYATGHSLKAALDLLTNDAQVLVCFSAGNLEVVSGHVPRHAVVAADNDASGTGERYALATGLRWTMPYEVGSDFNDLHQAMGLHVVAQRMRELLMPT